MVLGAVVEVVQLLLEVVQDLGVTRHVSSEDQDDHVAPYFLRTVISISIDKRLSLCVIPEDFCLESLTEKAA